MICIIVPSRDRPTRAAAMVATVRATASRPVRIVIAVDEDDARLPEYQALLPGEVTVVPRQGYTGALNAIAETAREHYPILGAFGDDVAFRTFAWDRVVEDTLRKPGMAYGDDLIHGKNHPTAVFVSSEIVKALGWLALPATSHQWADDAWKRLGKETGCLRFMDGVILEHLHPAVGKAEWDATYDAIGNDGPRAKRDFEGYTGWAEKDLAADADKVRAVL